MNTETLIFSKYRLINLIPALLIITGIVIPVFFYSSYNIYKFDYFFEFFGEEENDFNEFLLIAASLVTVISLIYFKVLNVFYNKLFIIISILCFLYLLYFYINFWSTVVLHFNLTWPGFFYAVGLLLLIVSLNNKSVLHAKKDKSNNIIVFSFSVLVYGISIMSLAIIYRNYSGVVMQFLILFGFYYFSLYVILRSQKKIYALQDNKNIYSLSFIGGSIMLLALTAIPTFNDSPVLPQLVSVFSSKKHYIFGVMISVLFGLTMKAIFYQYEKNSTQVSKLITFVLFLIPISVVLYTAIKKYFFINENYTEIFILFVYMLKIVLVLYGVALFIILRTKDISFMFNEKLL